MIAPFYGGRAMYSGATVFSQLMQPLQWRRVQTIMNIKKPVLYLLLLAGKALAGEFPEQTPAKNYWSLHLTGPEEHICGTALQGLVAKAVNNGSLDELLVIGPDGTNERTWIQRTEMRTGTSQNGTLSLMDAVKRYKALIKGYIVYRPDESEGDHYQLRKKVDCSANMATMMAGLRDGLPVSEIQEPAFQALGFNKLLDSRRISMRDVLGNNQLNQKVTCSLDPRTGNLRDLAVAHRMSIYFGNETAETVAKTMEPPFLILGWGTDDEFGHVAPASRQGGIETVSNWTRNLSFLSAGANDYQPKKIKSLHPATIDWNDDRRTISFMLSDGDNTGWILNQFWDTPYYGSSRTGSFPMGFSAALAQMAQMAPVVVDRLAETQPDNVSLIEFSGGYFYPDLFAEERNGRENILRNYSQQLNRQMKKTGARLLCFIVEDSASRTAQKAYQIFAEEIEQLDGMLVTDYAPYHKGEGKIYWAKTRDGIEIPAVTARFCMWENMNRFNAGSPDQIADFINRDSEPFSWVSAHAWSNHGTRKLKGMDAVAACIDQLSDDIRVVTPEEMIWRIRIAHNRKQTESSIEKRLN